MTPAQRRKFIEAGRAMTTANDITAAAERVADALDFTSFCDGDPSPERVALLAALQAFADAAESRAVERVRREVAEACDRLVTRFADTDSTRLYTVHSMATLLAAELRREPEPAYRAAHVRQLEQEAALLPLDPVQRGHCGNKHTSCRGHDDDCRCGCDRCASYGVWCIEEGQWCVKGTEAHVLAQLPDWQSGRAADIDPTQFHYEVRPLHPRVEYGPAAPAWTPRIPLEVLSAPAPETPEPVEAVAYGPPHSDPYKRHRDYRVNNWDALYAQANAARDEVAKLLERVAKLEQEVSVDDRLLADRNRLLDLFECEAHGNGCVPHAIEEVERLRALAASAERERQGELPECVAWQQLAPSARMQVFASLGAVGDIGPGAPWKVAHKLLTVLATAPASAVSRIGLPADAARAVREWQCTSTDVAMALEVRADEATHPIDKESYSLAAKMVDALGDAKCVLYDVSDLRGLLQASDGTSDPAVARARTALLAKPEWAAVAKEGM